ncbi:hypothetical protein FD720_01230, partial [Photobacterium damselae subsp. damselae]
RSSTSRSKNAPASLLVFRSLSCTETDKLQDGFQLPRFYVSTSKSIIKALINMHSFEIQLSPIG